MGGGLRGRACILGQTAREIAKLARRIGVVLRQKCQAKGLRPLHKVIEHQIKAVLRGSAAEAAGLAAGDEWLGLEVGARGAHGHWRVQKLDDVPLLMGRERKARLLVSRDKRLLRLALVLPQASSNWRLQAPTLQYFYSQFRLAEDIFRD